MKCSFSKKINEDWKFFQFFVQTPTDCSSNWSEVKVVESLEKSEAQADHFTHHVISKSLRQLGQLKLMVQNQGMQKTFHLSISKSMLLYESLFLYLHLTINTTCNIHTLSYRRNKTKVPLLYVPVQMYLNCFLGFLYSNKTASTVS